MAHSDEAQAEERTVMLDAAQKALVNAFQHGLPLEPRPFAAMAEALGMSEDEVLTLLRDMAAAGAIDRVGPVFRPHRAGASTLAAMAVPPERLDEVAALVSRKPEVNHNYEREHRFNLWFVIATQSAADVERVLAEIEGESGLPVLDLPLLEAYRIDLGFPLP